MFNFFPKLAPSNVLLDGNGNGITVYHHRYTVTDADVLAGSFSVQVLPNTDTTPVKIFIWNYIVYDGTLLPGETAPGNNSAQNVILTNDGLGNINIVGVLLFNAQAGEFIEWVVFV